MVRRYGGLLFILMAVVACHHSPSASKTSTGKASTGKLAKHRQSATTNTGDSFPKLTASTYKQHQSEQALVLMTINWGAKWRCSNFDKAMLQTLQFERLHDDAPDKALVFQRPVDADQHPEYIRYALLVDPGEYALSGTDLIVSKMGQKDDYLHTTKNQLIVADKSLGGTFMAQAGEPVYIGNFWVDCKYSPIVWRLYTEGQDSFNKHLQLFQQDYPFINLDNVQYRLFQTTQFGLEYQLP